MPEFKPALQARIERLLGRAVIGARFASGGYTPAERWVVDLDGGSSAFVKTGSDLETSLIATWLRREYMAYASMAADFMPRMLAWDDDGTAPILVLEDLSAATWPPPWTASRIEAVVAALERVASTPAPAGAPDLEDAQRGRLSGWRRVATDPAPLLGLGLATATWLEGALPSLLEASDRAELRGDALVHFDVRSDNLCILDARVVLIDWPGMARGSALFDLASWLPSLWREGGPPPWTLLEDSAGLSALLAGYFAAQAGQPVIRTAPLIREVQRAQLEAALPWAIRELGLPPAEGPAAAALIGNH